LRLDQFDFDELDHRHLGWEIAPVGERAGLDFDQVDQTALERVGKAAQLGRGAGTVKREAEELPLTVLAGKCRVGSGEATGVDHLPSGMKTMASAAADIRNWTIAASCGSLGCSPTVVYGTLDRALAVSTEILSNVVFA
jgi:hypothetical protein